MQTDAAAASSAAAPIQSGGKVLPITLSGYTNATALQQNIEAAAARGCTLSNPLVPAWEQPPYMVATANGQ